MTSKVRLAGLVIGLIAAAAWAGTAAAPASAAPACPLSYGMTDAAKSHKLFLYFPTAADATFPAYGANVSPAARFDVADLSAGIGTTAALRNRIYDVVADDYCEFNVQVLSTITNPATLASPPARRVTVAVGSDNNSTATNSFWGLARDTDTGDAVDVDFARVWGGTYTTCEGSAPGGGCTTGSLTGANATLDRWAQAIGGTAAHEAGHTYGLAHTDDDPPTDTSEPGPTPLAGEDSFHRHLMPAGRNLTGDDRATYRRHFSDRTFGLLATNVGLSIQTMHNWDLVNPNAAAGRSLRIDFLSPLSAVTVSWSYTGNRSPWINPVVSGPSGTAVFKGTTYKRFRITWSTQNPAWTGTAGVVAGGGQFHIGATFTGVDFNQPDPIIIQNVTLLDAGSNPLTLHPRLPMYDTGALDSADGTFGLDFFAPGGGAQLSLKSAIIYQLPRVASIASLTGAGHPRTFDNRPIRPWSVRKCAFKVLRKTARCVIAKVTDRPHILVTHQLGQRGVRDCSKGVPKVSQPTTFGEDSRASPDDEGPICAGTTRDPFPSATVYVMATFVDAKAKHYDRKKKRYVVGPVTSKLYYQFAGIRHLRKGASKLATVRQHRGDAVLEEPLGGGLAFLVLALWGLVLRARRTSRSGLQAGAT
jgi:hypothetical protein